MKKNGLTRLVLLFSLLGGLTTAAYLGDQGVATAAAPREPGGLASAADYQQAMRAGLRLLHRGHAAEAYAAFDRALRMAPQSARTLAELGRAALAKRDLPRALAAAKRAAALATEPHVKGDALDLLGQVLEARGGAGDRREALLAYERALVVHPSAVVREHLLRLRDGGLQGALHQLALDGPYATIADYCHRHFSATPEVGGWQRQQRCNPEESLDFVVRPGGPYTVLGIFKTRDEYQTYSQLAARTDSGWYFSDPVAERFSRIAAGQPEQVLEEVTAEPGQAQKLLVRLHLHTSEAADGAAERPADEVVTGETDEQVLLVCSLSSRPACTLPIPLRYTTRLVRGSETGDEQTDLSWEQRRLKARVLADGSLEIHAATAGEAGLTEAQRRLLGRHPLALEM